MAIDDPWARKAHYEKTGKWPMTSRQEKEAIAKNKRAREFKESLAKGPHPVERANALIRLQKENEKKNQLPFDFD